MDNQQDKLNQNVILSIENAFYDKLPLEEAIDIKKIKIFEHEKVAFLIGDDSKSLLDGNFWEMLNENKNQLVTSLAKKNELVKFSKGNKALKNIEFFQVPFFDDSEIAIPLKEQSRIFKKKFKADPAAVNDFLKTTEKYPSTIKNTLFILLKSVVNDYYNMFQKFEKIVDEQTKKYEKNLLKTNFKECLKILEELSDEQEEFAKELLKSVFETYMKFCQRFLLLNRATASNINYRGDSELSLLQNQFNFIKNIKDPTMLNVKKELIIRDNLEGIKILNNLLVRMKKNSKERMKYLIESFKSYSRINFNKSQRYRISSSQYQFLMKKSLLERYIYKKLSQASKKMKFLTKEQIKELEKSLKHEAKLFINNNLISYNYAQRTFSHSNIMTEIKTNFNFNFENYYIASAKNIEQILKNIEKNNANIKEAKRKHYKVYDNTTFVKSIKDLKVRIAQLNSEINWKINKVRTEYENTIKRDKKVFLDYENTRKIYERTYKNIKKINTRMYFSKVGFSYIDYKNNEDFTKLLETHNRTKRISEAFSKFVNDIASITKFLRGIRKPRKWEIKKFYLIARFIDTFDKSSVQIRDLISPFNEISYVNKVKILFITKLINKPKLIIIEDDMKKKDTTLKLELIRTYNELTNFTKSGFVFITNDSDLVNKKYFDYCFIFMKNREVEHGSVEYLLSKPVNPFVKKHILKQEDTQISSGEEDFVFSEEIKIRDDHFVIVPPNDYKKWTETIKVADADIIFSERDQEKTTSTIINEVLNPFIGNNTLVVDITKRRTVKKPTMNIYKNYVREHNKAIDSDEDTDQNLIY